MLLHLPIEMVLRVTEWLWVDALHDPAAEEALKALALTCRSLSPHLRIVLFSRIRIKNGTCFDLAITGIRSGSLPDGRVVRELSIGPVSTDSFECYDDISHDALADLLALLPRLSVLALEGFSGENVSSKLGAALGRMVSVRTLLVSPAIDTEKPLAIFSILSSLNRTVAFDLVEITMPDLAALLAEAFPLPARPITHLTALRLRETGQPRLHPHMRSDWTFWQRLAACCGRSMAYLDIPFLWLQPALLAAITPTVSALCLRGAEIPVDSMNQTLGRIQNPLLRLQVLQVPIEATQGVLDCQDVFASVQVLVLNRSREDTCLSIFTGIAEAHFETVVITAVSPSPEGEDEGCSSEDQDIPAQDEDKFSEEEASSSEDEDEDVVWEDEQQDGAAREEDSVPNDDYSAQEDALPDLERYHVWLFDPLFYPYRGARILRNAGVTVVDCAGMEYPDLLVLLETGNCVQA